MTRLNSYRYAYTRRKKRALYNNIMKKRENTVAEEKFERISKTENVWKYLISINYSIYRSFTERWKRKRLKTIR